MLLEQLFGGLLFAVLFLFLLEVFARHFTLFLQELPLRQKAIHFGCFFNEIVAQVVRFAVLREVHGFHLGELLGARCRFSLHLLQLFE